MGAISQCLKLNKPNITILTILNMNILRKFLLACFLLIVPIAVFAQGNQQLQYKVGFLGVPSFPKVQWDDANMQRMKELGFNTMQLNIAWGYRPNDEALNLEDVVQLPQQFELNIDRDSAKTLRTPERIAERSAKLNQRIAMCKKYGFRTIFHFGAPFVGYPATEPLTQSITDTFTINRYVQLIKNFHKKFPGVDDLLCYTYDQNAWLSAELGNDKSNGTPVYKSDSKFLNILATTWKKLNPNGKFWWEPWELSAGEVYKTMDLLDSTAVGMSIHSDIAEVQIALPADRWFKNVLIKASDRKIPVLAELWMGGPTEELEPYLYIACPLATLKALRAVNQAGHLTGIKEYYGNVPNKEDPNLRMTGIFFHNTTISDDDALTLLAKPYTGIETSVIKYWQLASEGIEFYPWDVSWLAREAGRSDPSHAMTAAVLKGASWQTPSWQSTRRSSFMRTDETDQPNFWEREDVQLRFEQAAIKMAGAIAVARAINDKVPDHLRPEFTKSVDELEQLKRRCLAYTYHLRETNLSDIMRNDLRNGLQLKPENIAEMRKLLSDDQKNQEVEEPIGTALTLLNTDVNKFLSTYFLPSQPSGDKNGWTITSQ
jgi:hypothetical protein